jgi:ABC-type transporter Mla subunit MlaD
MIKRNTFKRRSRRRHDEPPMRTTFIRGFLTIGLVLLMIWVGAMAFNGVPTRNYTYVKASLDEVGNLLRHDPIRIGGTRVGQVSKRGLGSDGKPEIELQLEPGVELPEDTKIAVRANGLLGARYIQLIPGDSRSMLSPGDTLRGGPEALTYGLPQTLDVLDGPTRRGLTTMLDGLGTGFLSRGEQINDAVRWGATGAPAASELFQAILARPGAARRLLPSLDSAMTPLAANRTELGSLLKPLTDSFRPFADEAAATQATLDALPPALSASEQGLRTGRSLLAAVDHLSEQVNRVLPAAPPALRSVNQVLATSGPALQRTRALLEEVPPTVSPALKFLRTAPPLLSRVDPAIKNLTPIMNRIADYRCDVWNFGATMRSMDGFAGVGEGPLGPAMAFRAEASVLSPGGTLGVDDGTGLLPRVQYPAPCTYLSKPYVR